MKMSKKKTAVWVCSGVAVVVIIVLAAVFLLGGKEMKQFREPKAGDQVAVMETSMGTIKICLYPEVAPKAVENFVTHAKEGYYDGLIFHRVINGFMLQGGDPTGTGMGGESIWGEDFEDEFSDELHNFRGALSMANAGANTNGSQFFIVQAPAVPASMLAQYKGTISDQALAKYGEVGGTPWLDGHHTVFGQVYEGMDVVDAIAGVETNLNDRPLEDVKIISITIEEYKG